MKDGAFFINTSRGEVVDEAALVAAIGQKGLRAGLDVFANEPSTGTGEFVTELAALPGVYGTHHIGASTDQAQEAPATEAVRIVKVFAETGIVPNVVNLATKTPATSSIVVRHIDRPGILAHTLDVISRAGINVQEMENIVFDGAEAAIARIHVEGTVEPSLVEAIKAHEAVIDVSPDRLVVSRRRGPHAAWRRTRPAGRRRGRSLPRSRRGCRGRWPGRTRGAVRSCCRATGHLRTRLFTGRDHDPGRPLPERLGADLVGHDAVGDAGQGARCRGCRRRRSGARRPPGRARAGGGSPA